uniref:Uncharacterized protein n=1 Tax=Glossina brevipalpis TaxID=37001 RepID=A0A1A9WQF7_9MUSC
MSQATKDQVLLQYLRPGCDFYLGLIYLVVRDVSYSCVDPLLPLQITIKTKESLLFKRTSSSLDIASALLTFTIVFNILEGDKPLPSLSKFSLPKFVYVNEPPDMPVTAVVDETTFVEISEPLVAIVVLFACVFLLLCKLCKASSNPFPKASCSDVTGPVFVGNSSPG